MGNRNSASTGLFLTYFRIVGEHREFRKYIYWKGEKLKSERKKGTFKLTL